MLNVTSKQLKNIIKTIIFAHMAEGSPFVNDWPITLKHYTSEETIKLSDLKIPQNTPIVSLGLNS